LSTGKMKFNAEIPFFISPSITSTSNKNYFSCKIQDSKIALTCTVNCRVCQKLGTHV
jgi:hypothetical protein